jgi:Asp-tRNA(Asn)/Glu-tRNA(Gln) amidotransferase A subunit family amidase
MHQRCWIAGITAAILLSAGCATGPKRPADLTQLSVTDAARLIQSGQVTSTELTGAYLDRAEKNKHLNAFITLDREKALAEAGQADMERAAGRRKGPLQGVPLVVKDNIHVAGMPNTAGTPGLREFVPAANAPVVQKLIDAGAIILGKTNMHELAFGISGYNEGFYQTEPIGVRNPYDLIRFAGGSSSGTGAAVGGRLAPGGLGSDTGGSVRIPAAVCGIAGFRPSIGRYSQEGITPIAHTRDTPGPMAQTVADVALLDAVITGEELVSASDLKGVRLGVARSYFFADLDTDTREVMDRTLARLAAAGAIIVEVDMPELKKLNDRVAFPIALYEAYDDMSAYLRTYGIPKTVEELAATIASKDVKGTYDGLVIPRKLPTPDGLIDAKPVYEAAIREGRPALQQYYADMFATYQLDALIFPTTPKVAVPQGPEASALETFLLFIRNTDPDSNAGIPGLSIPGGLGQSRMPVGVEIDGPRGSDRRLLSIGLAIERVLGRMPAP